MRWARLLRASQKDQHLPLGFTISQLHILSLLSEGHECWRRGDNVRAPFGGTTAERAGDPSAAWACRPALWRSFDARAPRQRFSSAAVSAATRSCHAVCQHSRIALRPATLATVRATPPLAEKKRWTGAQKEACRFHDCESGEIQPLWSASVLPARLRRTGLISVSV